MSTIICIVVASAGFAASFYNDWLRQMRGGTLATYEETTASILAALPRGPATLVVNPVFLLPDKRPDVRFVSTAHLLQEMDVPLASYLYSEAETAMAIKRVTLKRLARVE